MSKRFMSFIERGGNKKDTRVVSDMTRRYRYWLGHDEPESNDPPFWMQLVGDFDAPNGWRKWNGSEWVEARQGDVIDYYAHEA